MLASACCCCCCCCCCWAPQGLLAVAGAGVDADILVHQGDWSAVPATLPVVALAFVYHNVVPVIVTALQGDAARIRTAICAGVAIPWLMFVSWEGAILVG
jgi:tyrosine-specific transport protein